MRAAIYRYCANFFIPIMNTMIKHFCLLAGLLLFVFHTHAGSYDEFQLMVLDSITTNTVYNQVTVADMREDKDNIGYLRLGAFNKKNLQVPAGGLEQMLQQFAQRTAGLAQASGNKTLLIVVRDFSMADRPIEGEMGSFYARMDFYLGSGEQYRLVTHVDSFFETASGWDVTNNVKKLVAQKMTDWLLAMAEPVTSDDNAPLIDLATIKEQIRTEKARYPVYQEVPKTGVYYTLEQFLNNAPGTTEFIEKKYSISGVNVSYFYEKGEGKKKGASLEKSDCFAVYNGQKWFKRTSDGLLEMKVRNGDFYFQEVGYGIKKSDNMAIMFGMVGALIESTSNSRKGNALYRMRLDPNTGKGFCTERLR